MPSVISESTIVISESTIETYKGIKNLKASQKPSLVLSTRSMKCIVPRLVSCKIN